MKIILNALLSRFKWYRKLVGGRWELWSSESCKCTIWYHFEDKTGNSDRSLNPQKPNPDCRGTPFVEWYP